MVNLTGILSFTSYFSTYKFMIYLIALVIFTVTSQRQACILTWSFVNICHQYNNHTLYTSSCHPMAYDFRFTAYIWSFLLSIPLRSFFYNLYASVSCIRCLLFSYFISSFSIFWFHKSCWEYEICALIPRICPWVQTKKISTLFKLVHKIRRFPLFYTML